MIGDNKQHFLYAMKLYLGHYIFNVLYFEFNLLVLCPSHCYVLKVVSCFIHGFSPIERRCTFPLPESSSICTCFVYRRLSPPSINLIKDNVPNSTLKVLLWSSSAKRSEWLLIGYNALNGGVLAAQTNRWWYHSEHQCHLRINSRNMRSNNTVEHSYNRSDSVFCG